MSGGEPKAYLDIYVEDIGVGHKIYFIGLDNSVVDTKTHLPWFTVYANSLLPEPNLREIKDGIPLLFDPATFLFVPKPGYKVYKGVATHRSKVPDTVGSIMNRYNVKAGLYNIRYEARVALDFSRTHYLLGVPAPLVFLPNDKMVKLMEELIEKIGELKVMAVDIEVYSKSGGFPRQGDPILTITYTVFRLKDNIFSREWPKKNVKVLSIPRTAKDTGEMEIESRKLVEKLFEVIEKERPNIIVTYNGTAFDFPYMRPFITRSYYLLSSNVVGIWRPEKGVRLLVPHIDLMLVREYLGSSMGIRSHAAYALDDVALEVASQLKKFYDIDWLFNSEYIKAERLLNHAKLKDYWERDDPLFHAYVVADVYLTALIARVWLYSLFMLSALTGMPPTLVQSLNTGQIAEYLAVELLARLKMYPELRERSMEYSRSTEKVPDKDGWVFNRGKVYVDDYGVFGGAGKKVVELDFAQLYPSDMVSNTTDPTMFFIESGMVDSRPVDPTLTVPKKYKLTRKRTTIILGKRVKKSSTTIKVNYLLRIVPGYGPIAWFVYKLYTARKETKKLKKRAKQEKRIELLAPDQAIKILNNSFYGAFSKTRGNLVNEVISATVFWRTQKLLYEVIDFINRELPKKLGKSVRVLYGDTDSAYVLVDADADVDKIVEEVNRWIQERYGPFYYMELEDVYDTMVIPKQKDRNSPSAKSYICLKDGKPAKVKGEFYKLTAPLAIKERLLDFYIEVIKRKPKNKKELKQIVKMFLEREPIHKWFIKKSVSSLVNEDDSKKLKKLNKEFHYAALYSLTLFNSPGVVKLDSNTNTLIPYIGEKGWRTIRVRIDPREIERTQRAVIVHYLPHPSGDPKKFMVYVTDDGENAVVHIVILKDLQIEKEGTDERNAVEKYYVATFAYRPMKIPKPVLLDKVLDTLDKYVITPIYRKLVPAIIRGEGNVAEWINGG